MPKRTKKIFVAPKNLPNREEFEAQVHKSTEFINQVIKPILSQPPINNNSYDQTLQNMRKEILQKYHERVEQAKISYQSCLDAIESYDAFLEILDARDPSTCRFLAGEGSILETKKPLILVINKIDLIPRNFLGEWLSLLRKTTHSIAISAIDINSTKELLQNTINSICPKANSIAVIGLPNVGKSTICSLNPQLLHEIPSFSFVAPTEEICLLQAANWVEPLYQLALATISRAVSSQDQLDFFSIYGLPESDSPESVLSVLGQRWNLKPKLAAKRLLEDFWNGNQKWFCLPPNSKPSKENQYQLNAFEQSIPLELSTITFVQFAPGDAFTVDEELLGENFEEEEEDQNNEEEEK